MESEKPRAKSDLHCPFLGKPMKTVCHKCALWIKIVGKDPQSMQQYDSWDCSIAWLPVLLVENAQQSRQAGAAVESLRNEMAEAERRRLTLAAGAAKEMLMPRAMVDITPNGRRKRG